MGKIKNLRESLAGFLEESEIELMYSSYDIIGDIAIIKIPKSLIHKKKSISEAFHAFLPNIRTVAMILGPTTDTFRTRDLKIIYGEDNTETIYKEHGCFFKLDVKKVFFSPRLSFERQRIAEIVKAGETIINLFCGVGTFSILIAKKNPDVKVYSIDVNPDAYRYMVENVRLNHLDGKVIPLFGDARDMILNYNFSMPIDRVIMPLPDYAYRFLDVAINVLKEGGTLHYYDVAGDSHPRAEAVERIKKEASNLKRNVEIEKSRIVRSVGQRKYHIAVDAKVF